MGRGTDEEEVLRHVICGCSVHREILDVAAAGIVEDGHLSEHS